MMDDPVVILGAARTPLGSFLGTLAGVRAPALGSVAIEAAVERSGVQASEVDEVLMGCVLPAGLGQAPARQASLGAGLPTAAGCTTVNKMCGSGMKAMMLGWDALVAESARVVVAGGMESMSNAPYLVPAARTGGRLGHGRVIDHMFFDGLEDAYEPGRLMGTFAEECASEHGFTREAQDAFAVASLTRAKEANEQGWFAWEMAPVEAPAGRAFTTVERDEQPFVAAIEKIPTLRPAFRDGGTVTAANASSISDGAAALVLARRSVADRLGVRPLARVLAHATHADAPARFPTAPVGAIAAVLDRVGWRAGDVDLWEINEAFAVVTMAAMRAHDLPHERVNVHGGACALGHPIGASGARIVVTLLGALRRMGGRRGIASLCIGGGEATAVAVEVE
jgi:acetyl-CoA C-acetyltransferase